MRTLTSLILIAFTCTFFVNALTDGQEIVIYKNESQYYLNLYCGSGKVETPMLVSLYNTGSGLVGANTCFKYSNYVSKNIPISDKKPVKQFDKDYAYSTTTSIMTGATKSIECALDATSNINQIDVTIPTICSPGTHYTPKTEGLFGVAGLGMDVSVANSITTDTTIKSFLLTVYQTGKTKDNKVQGANITINKNIDILQPTSPTLLNTVSASKSFVVSGVNQIHFGENSDVTYVNSATQISNTLIFDINHPHIGLPEQVYNTVLAQFKDNGLECSQTEIYPNCNYTGEVSSLPNLYFSVSGNSGTTPQLVSIEYQQYVNMTNYNANKKIQLLLLKQKKVSNSAYYTRRYVTDDYANAIILGRSYLRQRVIQFDFTDRTQTTITVRIFDRLSWADKAVNEFVAAVAGAVGFFFLCVFLFCCCCCLMAGGGFFAWKKLSSNEMRARANPAATADYTEAPVIEERI